VKTVDKALKLLLHFGAAGRELSLGEAARGAGLHPSTAHRLLAALARHGFVQTGTAPGRYLLGLRLAELGQVALDTLELRAKARPVLERLMEGTRETVHLMVLDGPRGLYVDRVESPQRVRVASTVGQREHLHCSAVGKAILAHLPPARLETIIARGLPRLTARTLTHPGRLRRHLAAVARRGFALDNEEGESGIRCVGAPIFDHRGDVVASISVAGPAYRLPQSRLLAWAPEVREAAAAISTTLGYPGDRKPPALTARPRARLRQAQ
jgi:IclR family acetate operon transcriptional repressor